MTQMTNLQDLEKRRHLALAEAECAKEDNAFLAGWLPATRRGLRLKRESVSVGYCFGVCAVCGAFGFQKLRFCGKGFQSTHRCSVCQCMLGYTRNVCFAMWWRILPGEQKMEALEKSDSISTKKIGRVSKSKESPARFRCSHATGES